MLKQPKSMQLVGGVYMHIHMLVSDVVCACVCMCSGVTGVY